MRSDALGAAVQGARLLQQAVHQGGFAMVNVGDDGDIAKLVDQGVTSGRRCPYKKGADYTPVSRHRLAPGGDFREMLDINFHRHHNVASTVTGAQDRVLYNPGALADYAAITRTRMVRQRTLWVRRLGAQAIL